MKQIFILFFLLFSANIFGQKIEWIPFQWVEATISGKHFDKVGITIPVTIGNLPNKFNMQLDLGAISTMIYEKSFEPYLDIDANLIQKIDTNLVFWADNIRHFKFKNLDFKLGSVSFGKRNIGLLKNFGAVISKDSIHTEQHIGTIAPDIFQGKILIIDYPNKRICVTDKMPKQFVNATFQPFKLRDGRITIPLSIRNKKEDLLFDTGSSLFALMTTEKRAKEISNNKVVDSLKISSWGELYMVYGNKINSKIKFGQKELNPAMVFYDKILRNGAFYEEEKIWGITGNAYFVNNILIIDYKNKKFGIK